MEIQRNERFSKANSVFPPLSPPEPELTATNTARKKNRFDTHAIAALFRPKSQFRATALSIRNLHHYGPLFVNYLKARRQVFIVAKGWALCEVDGMEFDQYDTPMARWIIVHNYGEVLAGIRIAPTTSRCGLHSYMIRDAQLGLLEGLPLDPLHFEAPVAEHIWEATRLFVCDHVTGRQRALVQSQLMLQMASTARGLGVTHVIGIVPAVFKRWMQRIGMAAVAVGPKFELGGDHSQAAMMCVSQMGD